MITYLPNIKMEVAPLMTSSTREVISDMIEFSKRVGIMVNCTINQIYVVVVPDSNLKTVFEQFCLQERARDNEHHRHD